MNRNTISFKIENEEKEIALLKKQKEILEKLIEKVIISKDNLVNSNLSGKTYNKSIETNILFIEKLEERKKALETLITKLEDTCNIYNKCSGEIKKSINGGQA